MSSESEEDRKIIYQHLRRYLLETKQSKRWQFGDKFISLIERLLRIKKVVLSIDKIEALINLLESNNHDSPHSKVVPLKNILKANSIAFICSSDKLEDTTAGDVMTAFELISEFNTLTRMSAFLWDYKRYDLPQSDILLSLIYHADITKLEGYQTCSLRICWIRNNTENWVSSPWFRHFNVILCSSERIKDFITTVSDVPVYILPLASKISRFEDAEAQEKYKSDYVFTGNKWNEKRFLERQWNPDSVQWDFAIYGSSWSSVPKFKHHARGKVHYKEIPAIYRSTKIVIDDTNETTHKWESINSRVFDAIASKKIVLSNNPACKKLFGNDFPVFQTRDELEALLQTFFNDPELYATHVNHNFNVLKGHHTYRHRAQTLRDILSKQQFASQTISIVISVSEATELFQWGDYHFAKSLQRAFHYFGSKASIKIVRDWHEIEADDIVLVIQGLRKYRPRNKKQKVIYWLISHPDSFLPEDYSDGIKLYIASSSFYSKVKDQVSIPCEYLPQFGDSDIFYPLAHKKKSHNAVFVGHSRNIKRRAIQLALDCDIELKIVGKGWEKLAPAEMMLHDFISHDELNHFYQSCHTIVIDHWNDMKDEGFVSNKVYNLGLSKTNFITDDIPNIFEVPLQIYNSRKSFSMLLTQQMDDRALTNLRQEILNKHTHYHRAFHILDDLTKLT